MKNYNNADSLTIQTNMPVAPGMDYERLVSEGIKIIERLAGKSGIWTNYNTPDPGITILEHICYAITDLCYRISFPVQDILTAAPGEDQNKGGILFTAKNILTANPLTINDYRKLLLDIPKVRNAWLEVAPQSEIKINGLYNVFIEAVHEITLSEFEGDIEKYEEAIKKFERAIKKEVQEKLARHRNLCEDFFAIKILPAITVDIKLAIEIDDNTNISSLEQRLCNAIANEISPEIKFFSVEELLAKGRRIEDIFNGPSLEHGFIDDEELSLFNKKEKIPASDIILAIEDLKKVKKVKEILITADDREISSPDQKTIYIDKNKSLKIGGIEIAFYKNQYLYCQSTIGYEQFKTYKISTKTQKNNDIPLLSGQYRNLKDYTSIQEDLPRNYYVGKNNQPGSKINSQREQAIKQLKGYLLFFDQILANYFAQLDGVKQLFSQIDDFASNDKKTYFTQLVNNLGIETSLNKDYQQKLQQIVENKGPASNKNNKNELAANIRKNILLDYLLAIFGEKFKDYSGLLEKTSKSGDTPEAQKKLIGKKIAHLKKYDEISRDRNRAVNYNNQDWSYPLEKSIANLLGILKSDEKKIYIVEHILLSALEVNSGDMDFFAKSEISDPYSCRLSVIISGEIVDNTDEDKRKEIQQIIDCEIPAHLIVNYRWLKKEDFEEFKKQYEQWREKFLKNKKEGVNENTINFSRRLIRFLLNTRAGGIGYMAISEGVAEGNNYEQADSFKVS